MVGGMSGDLYCEGCGRWNSCICGQQVIADKTPMFPNIKSTEEIYQAGLEKGRQLEREHSIRTVKSLITYGGNKLSGDYNQVLEDVVQALTGEANPDCPGKEGG